jgi:hypothetical protein
MEVAIAGFAAGAGAGGSGSSGGGATSALPRFRTITGPLIATGFRFLAGRLGR